MWCYQSFKKVGENNVSESLVSQHQMGVPNITGVHGAQYGACWCDSPGEVQGYLKPLRYLKPENS